MKRLIAVLVAATLASASIGCQLPASVSEWVSDPLGIDRAVREHYFPDGVDNNPSVEISAKELPQAVHDAIEDTYRHIEFKRVLKKGKLPTHHYEIYTESGVILRYRPSGKPILGGVI